jgi:hypothetical protein
MQADHTKGSRGTMGTEFDRWLEEELNRSFATLDGGYVAPRYLETRAPRRGVSRLLAAVPALVTAQVAAAGIAVVAAASTGVAVHNVVTGSGSNDAATWGQKVVEQVQKCKAELGPGEHGIGKCVSQFAKQNGDQQSDRNGQGAGNDEDGSGDDGNGHGRPSAHPTPQGKGQGVTGSHPTPPAHPTPTVHPTPDANANGNAGSGNNNAGGNGGGKP